MDPMLASIFGGILLGVGLGFVLRAGATTGGTDLAAQMVRVVVPSISRPSKTSTSTSS